MMKKTVLALATIAVTGAVNAAPVSTVGVFTMYSQAGLDTNGVVPGGSFVSSDNAIAGFIDTAAGTWGVVSTVPFYGAAWTANGGALIQAPGTYSLNTGSGVVSSVVSCAPADDGNMCFTVGAGQAAGIIDFAWGVTTGIRVVNVWNVSGNTYTAAIVPGMENGPTIGFNAAFDLVAVPLPATVWLLGSGLVGLVGVARRRMGINKKV